MGHFLKTCSVANDALSAIYGVMTTWNICKDKRNSLFTVQSIHLMKLMTCLEKHFTEAYLRSSNKNNLLISDVFSISEKMVSRVSVLNTESLHSDDNGNFSGVLNIENKADHDICLNYYSKPTREKCKEEVIIELQ